MFNVYHPDHEYVVEKFPGRNMLCIQRDGVKRFIKVKEDENNEFIYKIQKTQIKAIDGVDGLYKFMEENRNVSDLFWCLSKQICDKAFSYMKEARV